MGDCQQHRGLRADWWTGQDLSRRRTASHADVLAGNNPANNAMQTAPHKAVSLVDTEAESSALQASLAAPFVAFTKLSAEEEQKLDDELAALMKL